MSCEGPLDASRFEPVTCEAEADGSGGATVEDVKLMADVIAALQPARRVEIKAAGGVRSPADAEAMIAAGATRLGTSGGVGLVSGAGNQQGY